jgi:hypothetical protein
MVNTPTGSSSGGLYAHGRAELIEKTAAADMDEVRA